MTMPIVITIRRLAMMSCLLALAPNVTMAEESAKARWADSLEAAAKDALEKQQPILVQAGAPWCGWCKQLQEELETEEVQDQLQAFTLLYLDVDESPELAAELNISAVPALRVLSPHGRVVASQDGFSEAAELIRWLKKESDSAIVSVDETLLPEHKPSLLEVVKIVRHFEAREATVREAAIRRLLPYPKVSTGAVVKALRDGNLASRLVAYELLQEWEAPLGEIDPWSPDSLTAERMDEVGKWMTTIDAHAVPGVARKLSDEELASAQKQLDRLLAANPEEAISIRERMARMGAGLLPEILARLSEAETDLARERLVALRYRLVAPDGLVLNWPGGLERLADTDAKVRHQAAQELAELATFDTQTLLTELFSDPDPLIRELSLQGLNNLGGENATEALASLLRDPEPNVRAAVLKQLAEVANDAMVNDVIAFVGREEDPQLLVHAIRFFREASNNAAAPTLIELLEHESWQVRAEAAEALGSLIDGNSPYNYFGSDQPETSPEIYDALLARLEDEDAFVVSKALESLDDINAERAVNPLVEAAMKHPPLSKQIVQLLAQGSEMRKKAIPHLQRFFSSEKPSVRAAALTGLSQAAPDNMQEELLAAANDSASEVRIAAASSFVSLINNSRPASVESAYLEVGSVPVPVSSGGFMSNLFGSFFGGDSLSGDAEVVEEATPAEEAESPQLDEEDEPRSDDKEEAKLATKDDGDTTELPPEPSAIDVWLRELYAGEHREPWSDQLREPLRGMLDSDNSKERVWGAIALIPLGEASTSLPVLTQEVAAEPSMIGTAATALEWLPWEDRQSLFWELYNATSSESDHSSLIYRIADIETPQLAGLSWRVLGREDTTNGIAQIVTRTLSQSYLGDRYYDTSDLTTRHREQLANIIKPHLESGSTLNRLVAVDLLLKISPEAALSGAQQLMHDESAEPALRNDAFQISLIAGNTAESAEAALRAIRGEDKDKRLIALRYFAMGVESLSKLPTTGFETSAAITYTVHFGGGKPIIPKPSPRLEAVDVRDLVDHEDPEIAALAGYLLTLFQDTAGQEPLLDYWRGVDSPIKEIDRLVYRGLASLDAYGQVDVLRTVYGRLEDYERSDFYWTIRIMSDREVLALRKQIRDEVGLSNLQ